MMQEKQEQQIEIVAPSTDKVMCDGGTGDLGHPAVYFKIDTVSYTHLTLPTTPYV